MPYDIGGLFCLMSLTTLRKSFHSIGPFWIRFFCRISITTPEWGENGLKQKALLFSVLPLHFAVTESLHVADWILLGLSLDHERAG